jgi:predicted transcriptional regulator
MAAGITTSIRMPQDIRDIYETLAQATGRARNDLMVEALRVEGQRRLDDIALILEGRDQARGGRLSPIDDVVARFKARRMLPADFTLGPDEAGAASV